MRQAVSLRPIKVMISSQCHRAFPPDGRTLTDIRRTLRDRIEAEQLFGQPAFTVWINEDAPAAGTEENSWERCLGQVRDADIVLVLDAGHAGWARSQGDIGICHAELMTAHNSAPAKLRIIPLRGSAPLADEDSERNARFTRAIETINAFSPPVATEEALIAAALKAVADAVTKLVALGVRDARKGNYHSGDALVWSRLNYADRETRMIATLEAALIESGGTLIAPGQLQFDIGGGGAIFALHAAPAGLGVPASRERVGRPFLDDYRQVGAYPPGLGPIHLIASQAGATEAQARALLGFPDVTTIRPPFGIFAADEVQQVQLALLKDCRDEATTRHAVHRLLDWLRESGEGAQLLVRAGKRRRIAEAIARETL